MTLKAIDAEASSKSINYPPRKAIDNNLTTPFWSANIEENMKSDYLWLQVELEGYSEVQRVRIINGIELFSNVEVRVGNAEYDPSSTIKQQEKDISKNEICNVYPDAAELEEQIDMVCNKSLLGIYVSFQILDIRAKAMRVREVEVYGKRKSKFTIINSFLFIFNF